MKFFLIINSLITILACWIVSTAFDIPERYVEREVAQGEMPGIWRVTPESESKVDAFTDKFPDWGASAPWKTFTLNSDSSCEIEFESAWLSASRSDLNSRTIEACSWSLVEEENASHKVSPILKLRLDFANNVTSFFSLYIYEENGELILWNFIGDPDDFNPQDFMKIE